MNIEKREMIFNEGTPEEEKRTMIVVDKGGYDLHEVTEKDVGKTFAIVRKPTFYTEEQWSEIQEKKV